MCSLLIRQHRYVCHVLEPASKVEALTVRTGGDIRVVVAVRAARVIYRPSWLLMVREAVVSMGISRYAVRCCYLFYSGHDSALVSVESQEPSCSETGDYCVLLFPSQPILKEPL